MSEEDVEQIEKDARILKIQSLDMPIGEEDDCILSDVIASEENIEQDIAKKLDTAAMKRELWLAVDLLPDEQKKIIEKHYKERMTLKEISSCFGVSSERVRRIESKAMRTLRIPSRCRKFKVYYEEYIQAASVHHVGVAAFQRTWTSSTEREAMQNLERETIEIKQTKELSRKDYLRELMIKYNGLERYKRYIEEEDRECL